MVSETIIIVAFILALIVVGAKILFKNKPKKDSFSRYSTEKFIIINIEDKTKNISDWVHSNCKELDYNFIYNSILQQLEEED